jgi:hypothetical protein
LNSSNSLKNLKTPIRLKEHPNANFLWLCYCSKSPKLKPVAAQHQTVLVQDEVNPIPLSYFVSLSLWCPATSLPILSFLLPFGINISEVILRITRTSIYSHEDNETNMLRQKDETMRCRTCSLNWRPGCYEKAENSSKRWNISTWLPSHPNSILYCF